MVKFVQMKDDFDPATTCGLCGGPIDKDGSAVFKVVDSLDVQMKRAVAEGCKCLVVSDEAYRGMCEEVEHMQTIAEFTRTVPSTSAARLLFHGVDVYPLSRVRDLSEVKPDGREH